MYTEYYSGIKAPACMVRTTAALSTGAYSKHHSGNKAPTCTALQQALQYRRFHMSWSNQLLLHIPVLHYEADRHDQSPQCFHLSSPNLKLHCSTIHVATGYNKIAAVQNHVSLNFYPPFVSRLNQPPPCSSSAPLCEPKELLSLRSSVHPSSTHCHEG